MHSSPTAQLLVPLVGFCAVGAFRLIRHLATSVYPAWRAVCALRGSRKFDGCDHRISGYRLGHFQTAHGSANRGRDRRLCVGATPTISGKLGEIVDYTRMNVVRILDFGPAGMLPIPEE